MKGLLVVGIAAATLGVPHGAPIPARLAGTYVAHFPVTGEQTTGTWHLRLGPGHAIHVWNPRDGVAGLPSFSIGPVSVVGDTIRFSSADDSHVCSIPATYAFTLRAGVLRLRARGTDPCHDRYITLAPNAWHRVGR